MTARLFRRDDTGRWMPTAEPMAQAPHLERVAAQVGSVVHWSLPSRMGAQPGDRFVVAEMLALDLLDRCGPHHPAWIALVDHSRATDPDGADAWLAQHEVWSARVLDPARWAT